ncbi:hypothetical protein [Clostridium sporogenes]|nr:hypothetical protein [Clostridium sporogenes]KOR24625.1 hypothetical protein ND00_24940 [Clostridium sp. L74]
MRNYGGYIGFIKIILVRIKFIIVIIQVSKVKVRPGILNKLRS